ncbi:MAG: tryptophan-rich sensory protein, partial [Cyanobacteria bacterium]|nr:tryptophan-rich sensory protein [Cyanobacteriota bacterium]MDW8201549.1 tryptophan-rich sensory protein [Cyanobacteriota bacterium SKYGB_h_bin112]
MKPVVGDSDRLRQLATLGAIWGSIAVNALSNIKPPNGINIGRLSNLLFAEVQIIPANYAFAIWGVI